MKYATRVRGRTVPALKVRTAGDGTVFGSVAPRSSGVDLAGVDLAGDDVRASYNHNPNVIIG